VSDAGPVQNPHDERLGACWKLCRFGAERVRDDADARRRVLEWIAAALEEFPGCPWYEAWARIVRGDDPDALRELLGTADYFALPKEARDRWRPLIQSNPFPSVIPGRTSRERRAFLSHLP
jgi:hypothetical protein